MTNDPMLMVNFKRKQSPDDGLSNVNSEFLEGAISG